MRSTEPAIESPLQLFVDMHVSLVFYILDEAAQSSTYAFWQHLVHNQFGSTTTSNCCAAPAGHPVYTDSRLIPVVVPFAAPVTCKREALSRWIMLRGLLCETWILPEADRTLESYRTSAPLFFRICLPRLCVKFDIPRHRDGLCTYCDILYNYR